MPPEQFLKTFSPAAANVDESNVRWNIHWQWILANLNVQPRPEPAVPVRENPELRKNSLRVLTAMVQGKGGAAAAVSDAAGDAGTMAELMRDIRHTNARVSLDAILALRQYASDKRVSAALVGLYPELDDPWRESALIGVALQAPDGFLAEALAAQSPERMKGFVATLCGQVTNSTHLASIIGVLADGPMSADSLKLTALQTLGRGLNSSTTPTWTGEMRTAFQKLLRSANPALPGATLPLVAKWDKEGRLSGEVKTLVAQLTIRLLDATPPAQGSAPV